MSHNFRQTRKQSKRPIAATRHPANFASTTHWQKAGTQRQSKSLAPLRHVPWPAPKPDTESLPSIDFSLPFTEQRLWVFDLKPPKIAV